MSEAKTKVALGELPSDKLIAFAKTFMVVDEDLTCSFKILLSFSKFLIFFFQNYRKYYYFHISNYYFYA